MEHNHMLVRPHESGSPGVLEEQLQVSLCHDNNDKKSIHLQSSYLPPSYAQARATAAGDLSFPDAPTTELAPIQPRGDRSDASKQSLPSLSSLTASAIPTLPALATAVPTTSTTSTPPQPQLQPQSRSQSQPYTPPQPSESSCSPPPAVNRWPCMNPLTAFYDPGQTPAGEQPQRMDVDATSTSTSTRSVASPDNFYDGRASSISLDDPDVRMAAEALGDLRADFVSSPPSGHTPLPVNSPSRMSSPQATGVAEEPLLSLLTTSHPLLATTIEGATSAYNNSKNLSNKFKTSAEYVEGYLGPIANTVGTVGRKTGVEGGVRWFLGARRRYQSSTSTSDVESVDGASHKRRKVDNSPRHSPRDATTEKTDLDVYGFTRDRRTSMSTIDTLPAYDDLTSPAYSESADAQSSMVSRPNSVNATAWQQRLFMSTSGLSIAMREESLRSLKYCLRWLRWANDHISTIIESLKAALEQYDQSTGGRQSQDAAVSGSNHALAGTSSTTATDAGADLSRDQTELIARIAALKSDVLKTLRNVIETVSRYAGGALPENARELVHHQFTSLPQRFRLAARQDASAQHRGDGAQEKEAREKEVREGAKRALVLAKEGLDMVSQVSGVLDGTIVSAEEWCDRLRRKKPEAIASEMAVNTSDPKPLMGVSVDGDTTMT